MSTSIEWTERTWNPLRGCSMAKGSETGGCLNCYAARIAARYGRNPDSAFAGYAVFRDSGPRWTGKVDLIESKLKEPLRWRKPSVVFANSMSDLFHESLSEEDIWRVVGVMWLTPQHTYQVLTKRADRMAALYAKYAGRSHAHEVLDIGLGSVRSALWVDPLPNLWLGVSVENRANKYRIDDLRATPAAVRFLSLEPLLEDIGELNLDGIHWVIIGGESGPGARPFDIGWARDIIGQCRAAGVAPFFKQAGKVPVMSEELWRATWPTMLLNHRHDEFAPSGSGRVPLKMRNKKGGDLAELPEDLRVREMPT